MEAFGSASLSPGPPLASLVITTVSCLPACLPVQMGGGRPASPAVDDWEIDIAQLQIDAKIASGAFSNLYKGSYCGQEVAVKILKDVQDDTSQYQEFLQVRACLLLLLLRGRGPPPPPGLPSLGVP